MTPDKSALLRFNPDGLAPGLDTLPRWVGFDVAWNANRSRWDKTPWRLSRDRRASCTDPGDWSSYQDVLAAYQAGRFDGMAIALGHLGRDVHLVGVDFDHVERTEDGTLALSAQHQRHLELFGSYAEQSISGEGFKVLGLTRGTPPETVKKTTYEFYGRDRFFLLTGHHLTATPTRLNRDMGPAIATFLAEMAPPAATKPAAPPVLVSADLGDDAILDRLLNEANGKGRALFQSGQGDGGPSENAQALLCKLAFYTRDRAQLDRLFRRSALYAQSYTKKWGSARGPSTWGAQQIENALELVTDQYTPPVPLTLASSRVEPAASPSQTVQVVPEVPGDAVPAAEPSSDGPAPVVVDLGHSIELQQALLRERVQRTARRLVDAEERPPVVLPAFETLTARLARPADPVVWVIENLLPRWARAFLVAQYKAGKTTLVANLIRSLLDGDRFLEHFDVMPIAGKVGLLDFEMSEQQLNAWLRDQRIQHTDALVVVPLRGQASSFAILDPEVRRRWAEALRTAGVTVLILDCLRPVLDALGLDENHDAGRFLVAFDALLSEAGIGEGVVVHHMGHSGERSRGDSRLRDWPDVEWRLVRQDDSPASPRYLSAYGRDVEVSECALTFDAPTRRLRVAGGTRRDYAAREALDDVLQVLREADHALSGRELEHALEGHDLARGVVRAALKAGVAQGVIAVELGPKRARLHRVADPLVRQCADVRRSAPGELTQSVRQCASAYRNGALSTHQNALDLPGQCADDAEAVDVA